MTFRREGMTLMEIIVVLVIVGIATAIVAPNFTSPTEQARAANAQNNLLAIYSAEQNYINNNPGKYCTTNTPAPEPTCAESAVALCAPDLTSINCNLSLNIQDDGTYTYQCAPNIAGIPQCTATRNSTSNLVLTLTLNAPVTLPGEVNPACTSTTGNNAGINNWCP